MTRQGTHAVGAGPHFAGLDVRKDQFPPYSGVDRLGLQGNIFSLLARAHVSMHCRCKAWTHALALENGAACQGWCPHDSVVAVGAQGWWAFSWRGGARREEWPGCEARAKPYKGPRVGGRDRLDHEAFWLQHDVPLTEAHVVFS